jgi:hypothetical protein
MSELIDEIREQTNLFGVNIDEDPDSQIDSDRPPKVLFDGKSAKTGQGDTEMQKLGLCDDTQHQESKGFWRRQFQPEATRRQKQYDWAFGVIMPLVCFFFDPIVFRAWDQSSGFLGAYKPFAYSGSAIAIVLMVTWLLWRERLGGLSGLFAGVFFVASGLSLAVGIVLLPFSLIGLVVLIGALGFTPLFTGVIFLRNGVRALRSAKLGLPKSKLVYASIVGALWGLAIPFALQMEVSKSLDLIARGTPETIQVQGWKLRLLAPIVDAGQVREAYWSAPSHSPERREMKTLYYQLTGKQIDEYRYYD